jgi:pilus assembly protein CpaE
VSEFLPIVVAGADEASRNLIARVAAQHKASRIVAEVDTEAALLDAAAYRRPRLVLIATGLAGGAGFDAADRLSRQHPGLYIAMLSPRRGDIEELRRAMQAGARACLFEPLADADVLRILNEALEKGRPIVGRRGTVVAVTSSKGGVGKSTISINLAVALKQSAAGRIALVDGDLYYGDVATLLDLKPELTVFDLSTALDEEIVDRFLMHHALGFDVLAAPLRAEQGLEIKPEQFRAILHMLQGQYDIVVVDVTVSALDMMLATLEVADIAILVTTLDVVCLKDVSQMLDLLTKLKFPRENILLVGNRYAERLSLSIKHAEQAIRGFSAVLPQDEHVVTDANRGVPVVAAHPATPFSGKLRTLAKTLIDQIGRNGHGPA